MRITPAMQEQLRLAKKESEARRRGIVREFAAMRAAWARYTTIADLVAELRRYEVVHGIIEQAKRGAAEALRE